MAHIPAGVSPPAQKGLRGLDSRPVVCSAPFQQRVRGRLYTALRVSDGRRCTNWCSPHPPSLTLQSPHPRSPPFPQSPISAVPYPRSPPIHAVPPFMQSHRPLRQPFLRSSLGFPELGSHCLVCPVPCHHREQCFQGRSSYKYK